jgi:ABC-type glycerol-3-phosphate transport system substrate-binding protein
VPTSDGTPRYIPDGWAYGIVTADPQRQALAAQLIERLVTADTLGAWSLAANRLPTQRAALALWPEDDFTLFAAEALEVASKDALILLLDINLTRSLHTAMLDVLSGATDAETATSKAVEDW